MSKRTQNILLILGIFLLGYFSWTFYLKGIFLNLKERTVDITSLKAPRTIHLVKMGGQGAVYGLELHFTGNSDQNIHMLAGSGSTESFQQITIKKGKVDLELSSEYYADDCYLIIEETEGTQAHLVLNYRFLAGTK